ncbi:MAG: MoaD/ThiS family protein [Endomicrobiia bacterium]
MSIKVRIPTPLQKLTNNQAEVESEGKNIKELIENLDKKYPGIKERLYDENGNLRRFINFFVNDKDIRFLEGENTELKDGDEVSIIPAIAGGKESKDVSVYHR